MRAENSQPVAAHETALRELLLAADRLAALTNDWYPDEYRYITADLFAALLELQLAARKMPSGR
ncbi:MAG: hypothetical protein RIN56_13850 [Sporomusaceae bacterium]|nr:hypothetical protein [Sporomusaceae bacterium]